MKRLLSYFNKYKVRAVLAPLFKCLEACFELFVPLVVADMIDKGIGGGDENYILSCGALLVVLALIGIVCAVSAQYFSASAAAGVGKAISDDLFSHIMDLSYAELDSIGKSTLITRLSSDITRIQTGINMALRLFMRSPFIVFGSVVMAFTVDVKSALIFTVLVPILCVIVFGILIGTMPYYKKVQQSLDRVTLLTRETLSGQRVIRAFNREEREKTDFLSENQSLVGFQLFAGKISALTNPLTLVAVNLGIVCLLKTDAVRVNIGALTQGQTVALVNYMNQILIELIKLANLIIVISRALTSMKRVSETMDVTNSMQDGSIDAESCLSNDKAPLVEFSKVGFAYGNAKAEVLHDISFKAYKGESIGIIGGTGAGKSTLVNLIPRLYERSSGQISIAGESISSLSIDSLRGLIGFVPQKAGLFAMSIRDNLRLGNASASDEELRSAMETAQIGELLSIKEGGLDYMIEQDGRNLSGGQRQRLTIARALAKKPRILILDDAASALDFATDAKLRKAIKALGDELCTFIVSQRVSAVRDCDRLLVLSNGELCGIGTHKELLRACPEYREICESQMTKEEVERDER